MMSHAKRWRIGTPAGLVLLALNAGLLLALGARPASAQIKVVAYNCYHKPLSSSDLNWTTMLGNLGSQSWYDSYYGPGNYGTIPQRPTILCLTELDYNGGTGSRIQQILNSLYGGQGANYQRSEITAGSYEDYAFVYDSTKVQLLDTMTVGIGYRPAHRGHFRPVGYTSTNSDFYIYNCHLKAYPGQEATRYAEVAAMLFQAAGAADELPTDANIMYVGDFNFTTTGGETGYDLLLNPYPGMPNPGVAFDPLTGVCNPPYGSGAPAAYCTYDSGGPWSRIDFQFPTTELGDAEGMDLIPGAYEAHGNRNGSTRYYPAISQCSDHLGVVADYQLPAKMSVSVGGVSSPVIVGAVSSVNVAVENVASVIHVAGADELDYTIQGDAVASPITDSDAALGGGNVHSVSLDTLTAGPVGQLEVTSGSPAVQDGSFSQAVALDVLDHSQGSFAAGSDLDTLAMGLGDYAPQTGQHTSGFSIHNLLATAGYTADLDIDGINGTGDTASLYTDVAPTSIAAGSSEAFLATLDTAVAQGLFSAEWTISVSDEDLPGALAGDDLVLTLTAYVAIDGDANVDRTVDGADFNLLLTNWGTGDQWGEGDFTGDGTVDGADFNLLLSNWGDCPDCGNPTPEPATLALLCLGVLARRWRR